MNYKQALEYIHSVSWLGSKPGLSRTKQLLGLMGNPQDKLKFVHVAGTNGKGSTCAMLSAVLKEAGYKVGLYTSPYILRFNERMQISGKEISDGELAEITGYVKTFADKIDDTPTEFELITAIGFEYFFRNSCDIVVLEVGMGGELDSTNVIKAPELAIITELALDHTAVLGTSMFDIAKAKAGIIKEGSAVLSADNTEIGAKVILESCNKLGCNLFRPEYDKIDNKTVDINGIAFNYKGYHYSVSLCGSYQFRNAAMVLKAVEVLNTLGYSIHQSQVKAALNNVAWRARFEILNNDPCFIYDGGHNPQGVSAAIESYREIFGDVKPIILIGLMADKDFKKELHALSMISDCFVSVKPNNPRAMTADALASEVKLTGANCVPCDNVHKGVSLAIEKANGDMPVLAIGSLYMYSEVKAAVDDIFNK